MIQNSELNDYLHYVLHEHALVESQRMSIPEEYVEEPMEKGKFVCAAVDIYSLKLHS